MKERDFNDLVRTAFEAGIIDFDEVLSVGRSIGRFEGRMRNMTTAGDGDFRRSLLEGEFDRAISLINETANDARLDPVAP